MLLDTRDEVYGFRDKYQSVFRPYFDVVPFSKLEFYRLLCADACSLCARKLHKEVFQMWTPSKCFGSPLIKPLLDVPLKIEDFRVVF